MKHLDLLLIAIISLVIFSCKEKTQFNKANFNSQKVVDKIERNQSADFKNNSVKVTFIELGSVRCIPCQKMQKVIKSVEEKYGTQVKTIFYDVLTTEGKPYADTYEINLIPTQIFLDSEGEEYYRHEGFFPEEELIKILNQKGVQ